MSARMAADPPRPVPAAPARPDRMRLRVLLPAGVEIDERAVTRVVLETTAGSHCLLPRHIDFVAMLSPGILTFDLDGTEQYAAVNGGIAVKVGDDVLVATAHAVRGADLGRLQAEVERAAQALEAEEHAARSTLGRLEADFVRRMMESEPV